MISIRKYIALLSFVIGGALCAQAAYIPLKAALAQVLLERAWAHSLETQQPAAPWASMDARPLAKISMARLGASDIVMDSTSGQALAFGPTHMAQTAKPGQAGLSVIAAHKNTHFSYISDVVIGDVIQIEAMDGQIHDYTVTHTDIVDKDASGISASNSGPASLALVTCYPFDALSYGGPLRYIVYASKA